MFAEFLTAKVAPTLPEFIAAEERVLPTFTDPEQRAIAEYMIARHKLALFYALELAQLPRPASCDKVFADFTKGKSPHA